MNNVSKDLKLPSKYGLWGAQHPMSMRQLLLLAPHPLFLVKELTSAHLNSWAIEVISRSQQQKLTELLKINILSSTLKERVKQVIQNNSKLERDAKKNAYGNVSLWQDINYNCGVLSEAKPTEISEKDFKIIVLTGEVIPRELLLQMVKLCNDKEQETQQATILSEISQNKIYTVPSTLLFLYYHLSSYRESIQMISSSMEFT